MVKWGSRKNIDCFDLFCEFYMTCLGIGPGEVGGAGVRKSNRGSF